MAYYNTCPDCGANLDPGETCDCKDRINEKTRRAALRTEMEQHSGQLRMILRRKNETVSIG